MAGDAVFLYSSFRCHIRWQQSLLQPLLRAWPAFRSVGRKTEIVKERTAAQIFAQPVVPVWIPGLFYDNVRFDVV